MPPSTKLGLANSPQLNVALLILLLLVSSSYVLLFSLHAYFSLHQSQISVITSCQCCLITNKSPIRLIVTTITYVLSLQTEWLKFNLGGECCTIKRDTFLPRKKEFYCRKECSSSGVDYTDSNKLKRLETVL